jgi:glycosyltransferase involved in cell wall biosynthesis
MAQEKRIGIIYSYNENWIGAAYYIQNLIRSLNFLPEDQKIKLYVLTKSKELFHDLKNVTGYEKMEYIQYEPYFSIFERVVNRLSNLILRKKVISKTIQLDWVFPNYIVSEDLKHISNLVFWIPDFQDKYLPNFFSPQEIFDRNHSCEVMVASNYPIVFSSQTALDDFKKFYPDAKNKIEVLKFAVVHPDLQLTPIEEVKMKYGIEGDYFISPNQFWQHKNQNAIIEATSILKNKGINLKIVFTGKEHDYRNPDYSTFLKQKVIDYKLQNEILFLGFIDRTDQLTLMKHAQAVIQPSLFEGWSTVVEDAKALNQTLIVSNIPVHKEQLEDKAYFFNPEDFNELASKIIEVIVNPKEKIKYDLDYLLNIKKFAKSLNKLINY